MTPRPQPGTAKRAARKRFAGLLAAAAVAIGAGAPARAQKAATAPAEAEAPFEFARTPGRLPKDIVPVEYVLHLLPDLAGRSFRGRMTVAVDVRRPTAVIVMNALDLEVESAHVSGRAWRPWRWHLRSTTSSRPSPSRCPRRSRPAATRWR